MPFDFSIDEIFPFLKESTSWRHSTVIYSWEQYFINMKSQFDCENNKNYMSIRSIYRQMRSETYLKWDLKENPNLTYD